MAAGRSPSFVIAGPFGFEDEGESVFADYQAAIRKLNVPFNFGMPWSPVRMRADIVIPYKSLSFNVSLPDGQSQLYLFTGHGLARDSPVSGVPFSDEISDWGIASFRKQHPATKGSWFLGPAGFFSPSLAFHGVASLFSKNEGTPLHVFFVVDACFSGSWGVALEGCGPVQQAASEEQYVTVISSSGENEVSYGACFTPAWVALQDASFRDEALAVFSGLSDEEMAAFEVFGSMLGACGVHSTCDEVVVAVDGDDLLVVKVPGSLVEGNAYVFAFKSPTFRAFCVYWLAKTNEGQYEGDDQGDGEGQWTEVQELLTQLFANDTYAAKSITKEANIHGKTVSDWLAFIANGNAEAIGARLKTMTMTQHARLGYAAFRVKCPDVPTNGRNGFVEVHIHFNEQPGTPNLTIGAVSVYPYRQNMLFTLDSKKTFSDDPVDLVDAQAAFATLEGNIKTISPGFDASDASQYDNGKFGNIQSLMERVVEAKAPHGGFDSFINDLVAVENDWDKMNSSKCRAAAEKAFNDAFSE